MAWLSRAEVVQLDGMLVFALPGSPRAAAQCLDILAPVLGRAGDGGRRWSQRMIAYGEALQHLLDAAVPLPPNGYRWNGPAGGCWPAMCSARSRCRRSTIRRWTASRCAPTPFAPVRSLPYRVGRRPAMPARAGGEAGGWEIMTGARMPSGWTRGAGRTGGVLAVDGRPPASPWGTGEAGPACACAARM
jgi:hypothetical protein